MNLQESRPAVLSAIRDAYTEFERAPGMGETSLQGIILDKVTKALGVQDDTEALDHSIQARSRNLYQGGWIDTSLVNSLFFRQRTEVDIAPYGFLSRDLQMRKLYTLQGNDIVQAAVVATVQKVQTTEWVIEGPKRTAAAASQMIRTADFNNGYDALLSKSIQDWCTQDNGMFWELIWSDGKFDAMELGAPRPSAQLIGFAHMDATRCRRTGNPEFPVVYQGLTGGWHKMHRTRVLYGADLPSPNERLLGRGFCSMSRALAVARATVRYAGYRDELLDDLPPLGMLIYSNLNKATTDQQKAAFQSQRQSNEQFFFSNVMEVFSIDPTKPADAKLLEFKHLWDNFSERDFYDMSVDIVAMSFGLDRQELAPLATSALGSGAQSTVLAQKARGKGIGNLLSFLERRINMIIPSSCTFKFDFHDDEQDFQQAQIRQQKVGTIISLFDAGRDAAGKPGTISKPKPLAGDSLKAFGQPADGPVQNTPDNAPANPPPIIQAPPPPPKETLISADQAKRLLMKEIPEWADILQNDEAPDEATFNDTQIDAIADATDEVPPAVQAKAFKLFGEPVKLWKSGKMQSRKAAPRMTFNDEDLQLARAYMKAAIGEDVEKYNANHDAQGRFTSGGGGGAGISTYSPRGSAHAYRVDRSAVALGPELPPAPVVYNVEHREARQSLRDNGYARATVNGQEYHLRTGQGKIHVSRVNGGRRETFHAIGHYDSGDKQFHGTGYLSHSEAASNEVRNVIETVYRKV